MSDSHVTNLPDLDDRLQAAYAAMGPSADTRKRVLASLQAEEATAVNRRVRRPHWHIVVPLALAACLAIAVVVVLPNAVLPTARQAAQDAPSESESLKTTTPLADAVPEDSEGEQNSLAQDADTMADSMAAEVSSTAEVPSPAWSLVELEDGRRFDVGDPTDGSVDEQKAQKATAYGADESDRTSCEVVDERYVRFPNSDVWYVLVPRHS